MRAAIRATIWAAGAACMVAAGQALAASAPRHAGNAAQMRIEARQDRWQGRHHFLYDDEYQPGQTTAAGSPERATVGAAPSDARACARETVRVKRADGSTEIRHSRRCD